MTLPTLGILAGMGPRSTAPFVDLVVTECQVQYGARDDADFPKMMICSQPTPFYEDRPIDHAAFEAAVRAGLQHLERTGADFLAIACNTAHVYYRQLAASVSVPVLNMVELAVASVPGSTGKVALIAARPTAEAGIYQESLRKRGLEIVELGWQSKVDHLLGAIRTSSDPALFRQLWAELISPAQAAGVEAIVVACLDLSAILVHAPQWVPIVDASQSLAREIVRQWLVRRDRPRDLELARDGYTLSTDPARLDVTAIHAYLTRSYWAKGIPREVVAESIRHSLGFGLYASQDGSRGGEQVGFARVVTDRSTFAYLCDVFVLEEHRGKGLGKWLMEAVTRHPALQKVRRFVLVTQDAHELYRPFGFTSLKAPERYLEIHRPDLYRGVSP